ncbi:DUF4192 domain-containing protein [Amycolatopsis suaedae]|uniref:DUF4192 domain-containing protein n=1 Tax=Amycolatopsis suaedae TaxID=2510978 RepID=A0A4Q7J0K9_9PSEU|nr:DUF4192 domain-containing protein [Amycolatopsis suaedae]RZQ59916.1 DUF4192 domain-containing protein [Amycolatopsis suaedae]
MTTSSRSRTPRTRIKLGSDPGDLLAALPYLLGFRPARSLVLIGHRGRRPSVVGRVARLDLPPPRYDEEAAAMVVTPGRMGDDFGVTLVVVGKHDEEPQAPRALGGRLPHSGLVDAVGARLAGCGIGLLHAMWVPEIGTGEQWHCYQDTGCGGVLPEIESSVAAATVSATGQVTYGSRDEMAAVLAPDPPDALARRSALLAKASVAARGDPAWSDKATAAGLAVVRAALTESERGTLDLTDDRIVRLATALGNSRVRDACLALAVNAADEPCRAAERLWLALTRATPAPERADPASLLAYAHYQRGSGAFAVMALEAALDADPGHVLSTLLLACLNKALPPRQVAGVGRSAKDDLGWPEPAGPTEPGGTG